MRNFLISTFAVLTYLVFCDLGVYGLNCSSPQAIRLQVQNECLSRLNLSHQVNSSEQTDMFQSALANNLDEICRNQESFKAAYNCAINVLMSCPAVGDVLPDFLPDVSKMSQGIRYLCDHQHYIDAECYKKSKTAVDQCTLMRVLSAIRGNTNSDIKSITCRAFEIGIECQEENLNTCSGRTKEILVSYMQNYPIPPICQTENISEEDFRFTTMASVTAAQLVTNVPVLPDVSCYNQTSVQEGQRQCFTREGFTIQLPKSNVQGSLQTNKQNILDVVIQSNENLRRMCGDLPRYQRAMECAMELPIQCMPADHRDYLPRARNVDTMVSELCENIDDINQDCAASTSMASALFDCGYRKGVVESQTTDLKKMLCKIYSINMACQLEVLPACGCRTVQVYSKLSKDYLNPPACPPIQYRVPECDPADPMRFSVGVAERSSVGLLVLLALLTTLLHSLH